MARSKRKHSTVTLTIDVPKAVSRKIPARVNYAAPLNYGAPDKTTRVRLRTIKPSAIVKKKVTVRLPAVLPKKKKSYVMFRPGMVNIYSRARTERLLEREANRKRKRERKRKKNRGHHSQLSSLRRDPHGIVASAVALGRSPDRVADAAMIARAIRKLRF